MNITQEGEEQKDIMDQMSDIQKEYTLIDMKLRNIIEKSFNDPLYFSRPITFMTGERRAFDFDTEMKLVSVDDGTHLKEMFRELRSDYYQLNKKYQKAITPWYKKVYYWLKDKLR